MTDQDLKPADENVHITKEAADKFKEALAARQDLRQDGGFRLSVMGGGCSGLQYDLDFEDKEREGDRIFEEYGMKIFVDSKSYPYVKGITIDYLNELNKTGFVFLNPNAKGGCGCGESFNV